MRTLIISMTCGEGHNYIAKAIKNSLDKRGEDNKIIQLYGYSEKEVARQNKMFLNASKYIPHIYEKIWLRLRKRNPNKPSWVMNGVVKDCKDYILKQINEYNPDNIVCTHNNAGAVVDYLKTNNLISDKIKTYSIAFDYCLCPYWETNRNLDYVVTPHEFTHKDFIERGFKEEQLLPFGLMVDEKFTKKIDKKEARDILGIDQNVFTIVLYSGGNCLSKASTLIKQLIKVKLPVQIIAICGRNQKEYKRIEKIIKKKNLKNITNLGFCNNIDVLYSAGDLLFTRCGSGLIEQTNKQIPFILREKMILNERITKKMFTQNGLGLPMKKLSDAPRIVEMLYNDREKLARMSMCAKQLCKSNSTENFVDFLLKNRP